MLSLECFCFFWAMMMMRFLLRGGVKGGAGTEGRARKVCKSFLTTAQKGKTTKRKKNETAVFLTILLYYTSIAV